MYNQKIKSMMDKYKQREKELIQQSKKRHEEIIRNTQKKRLDIIKQAEKKKQDILRSNIEFQKKEEKKLEEFKKKAKERIGNLIMAQRQLNQTTLLNIIRANCLRQYNIINNNINNNNIIIENIQPINDDNNKINNGNSKILELLQDMKLTKEILEKIENKQCLICLDNYEIDENLCYLPCFHLFHSDCIKTWIKKSNKCPLCKNIIKLD